jgi:MYXO-CTERM domain-containing protein
LRASAFCFSMTLSAVSLAHVDLTSPAPRAHGQTEGNLKSGPCGQTTNGRTSNVTVFTPGETIDVVFNEYIDHPAYYRIAFDDDGDDGFAMRTDGQTNPAADDPEAMEAALNMEAEILAIVPEQNDTTPGTSTDVRSVEVTLPNITCENCTLQVIQYMYNNPAQGYFQCADIALRQESGSGDAGPGGEGGSGDEGGLGGAGGSGGAAGSGTAGASSTAGGGAGGIAASGGTGGGAGASSGGSAPAGSGGGMPVVTTGGDTDSGCAMALHDESRAGLFGLFALGLGLITRRRRV